MKTVSYVFILFFTSFELLATQAPISISREGGVGHINAKLLGTEYELLVSKELSSKQDPMVIYEYCFKLKSNNGYYYTPFFIEQWELEFLSAIFAETNPYMFKKGYSPYREFKIHRKRKKNRGSYQELRSTGNSLKGLWHSGQNIRIVCEAHSSGANEVSDYDTKKAQTVKRIKQQQDDDFEKNMSGSTADQFVVGRLRLGMNIKDILYYTTNSMINDNYLKFEVISGFTRPNKKSFYKGNKPISIKAKKVLNSNNFRYYSGILQEKSKYQRYDAYHYFTVENVSKHNPAIQREIVWVATDEQFNIVKIRFSRIYTGISEETLLNSIHQTFGNRPLERVDRNWSRLIYEGEQQINHGCHIMCLDDNSKAFYIIINLAENNIAVNVKADTSGQKERSRQIIEEAIEKNNLMLNELIAEQSKDTNKAIVL